VSIFCINISCIILHSIVSNPSLTKSPVSSKRSTCGLTVLFSQLAHTTLGQASMEGLDQENQALREEIETMRARMDEMAATQAQVDELTELVRTLKAAQNQPPPPPPPVSTQVEASSSTIFSGTAPFSTSHKPLLKVNPGVHLFALLKYFALLLEDLWCLLFNLQFTLLHQYQRTTKANLRCLLFNMQSMFLLQL